MTTPLTDAELADIEARLVVSMRKQDALECIRICNEVRRLRAEVAEAKADFDECNEERVKAVNASLDVAGQVAEAHARGWREARESVQHEITSLRMQLDTAMKVATRVVAAQPMPPIILEPPREVRIKDADWHLEPEELDEVHTSASSPEVHTADVTVSEEGLPPVTPQTGVERFSGLLESCQAAIESARARGASEEELEALGYNASSALNSLEYHKRRETKPQTDVERVEVTPDEFGKIERAFGETKPPNEALSRAWARSKRGGR